MNKISLLNITSYFFKRGHRFNYVFISFVIFLIFTFFCGIIDLWIITNLPFLVNSIGTQEYSTFTSLRFLFATVISLCLRLISLKQLTKTGTLISEIFNDINLLLISLAKPKTIGNLNPDNIRVQILNNSYDLHRYIIMPGLSAFYAIILSIFLCTGSVIVSPSLSLFLVLVIGIIFILIFSFSKNKYNSLSKKLEKDFLKLDNHTREFSENIKEIYIYNIFDLTNNITKAFRRNLYSTYSSSVFQTRLPKTLVESIILITIAGTVLFSQLLINPISLQDIFGQIFALGIVGVRLITLLSQGFNCLVVVKTYSHYFNAGLNFNNIVGEGVNIKNVLDQLGNSPSKKNHFNSKYKRKDFLKLSLNSIKSQFIKKTYLDPIYLEIKKSGLILIKGTSGCGKTTLLNIICNFIKPESGEIYISDKDTHKREINKNDVAYAKQFPLLFNKNIWFNISLTENGEQDYDKILESARCAGCFEYSEYMRLKNKNNENINKLVIKFLNKTAGRDGSNVSGGQKKRISLARAFYSNKKIILLDEPTSGLDNIFENYVIKEIVKRSKDDIFIISTHSDKFDSYAKLILNL